MIFRKEDLRIFGVFDADNMRVVFSAVKYSDCKRYVSMMAHSLRNLEILRFDVNPSYVSKTTQTTNN